MSVKIVRLITGEELICTIDSDDGITYSISDVAILIPTQQNSLGLAPFLAYANYTKLDLKHSQVMFVLDPVDELANQYRTMFGKIHTQTRKIIV